MQYSPQDTVRLIVDLEWSACCRLLGWARAHDRTLEEEIVALIGAASIPSGRTIEGEVLAR